MNYSISGKTEEGEIRNIIVSSLKKVGFITLKYCRICKNDKALKKWMMMIFCGWRKNFVQRKRKEFLGKIIEYPTFCLKKK